MNGRQLFEIFEMLANASEGCDAFYPGTQGARSQIDGVIGPDHRFMHDGTYKKTLDFEGFSGAWCFIVILHFPHHLLPPAGPA